MGRKPWIWILIGVAGLIMLVAAAPDLTKRLASLGIVWTELTGAEQHQVRVIECGGLALRARHNHDVIERAAHYVASHGSNTLVYVRIAQLAAAAEFECDRLDDVLDLAVMKTSESDRVLALARSACTLAGPAAEERWQNEYAALLATAEHPDLESAEANMEAR